MGKAKQLSRPSFALLLAFYACAALLLHWQHHHLPAPQPATAAGFSEARVRANLDKLFSVGVRVVGSESNEVRAREMILGEVAAVQEQARHAQVDVDVQVVSGSFELEFLTRFTNAYANVTNILVLVHDGSVGSHEALADRSAVLFSSHYDAALGAGAASDAAVHICTMLELLRLLATADRPPAQPVLFNFNGAEESILQAAHGFITEHPWRRLVRAFINLEAAGAGGRELLFQSGANELTEAYAAGASYPHGSVVGQDIFAAEVIPGETDYRIYRDFGALPGLDLANVANGYVYHTPLDEPRRIDRGSIQRCGENVLGALRELQAHDAPPMPEGNKEDSVVYFDVLGLFMVTYAHDVGVVLNSAVVFAGAFYALAGFGGARWGDVARAAAEAALAALAALAAPLALAWALAFPAPMFWYSRPYLAALVFGGAALAAALRVYAKPGRVMDDEVVGEARFVAALLGWAALAAALTLAGLGSAYVPAAWVLFPLLARAAAAALTWPAQRGRRLALFCLGQLPPLVLTGQLLYITITFFVPIMGRAGTGVPGDLVVAALWAAVVLLLGAFVPSALVLFGTTGAVRARNFFSALALAFALVAVATHRPYSTATPKRMYMQAVHREFPSGEADSGVWLNAFDSQALAPVLAALPAELLSPEVERPSCDLAATVYCDYPWFLPLADMLPMHKGRYVAGPRPSADLHAWVSLLGSDVSPEGDRRTLHLRVVGPDHMALYLDAPTPIIAWSLDAALPPAGEDHFIFFGAGGDADWRLSLTVPADAPPLGVGLAAHYLNETTPQLEALEEALPVHMTSYGWVSLWRKYSF